MLETAVVIFREGLEAFLIVAIMLAYVTKTGREHLKKPIYVGVAIAVVISATTGWHVAELAKEPVWEGSLALIAGLFVASFTLYMMKNSKNISGNIGKRIEKSAQKTGAMAGVGVLVFTILMVAREGMETALMLGSLTGQEDAGPMWIGAFAGAALVGMIVYLWISQSSKINLKLFLQVTGVFLILFAIDLFMYGLHEISEMNAIPLIGEDLNVSFHLWTEIIEHPIVSNVIAAALLIIPCAWLGSSYVREKMGHVAVK